MTKGKRTCKADDWAFTIYFLPALINFNEEISFFWFVEVSFLCNLCGVVTATVASLEKSGTVVHTAVLWQCPAAQTHPSLLLSHKGVLK